MRKDNVDIGGLRIAFERRGAGRPLLLLHGGVSDSREWRRQLDGLADEFTVVAWDAPGCGLSSDPPARFLMPDYADCLAGFVDSLGLDRPHVAGLSFGGTLALELYRRHPRLPRTLALVSAYTGWAGSLSPTAVAERLAAVRRDSRLPPREFAALMLPTLLSANAPVALADELASIIADFHPRGARTMAQAMARADLRDVLPNVDVPTLLVYGTADLRSPVSVAEELHAGLPASTLVVLPGAGHQLNMEAADELDAALRAFLREHDRRGHTGR